MQSLPYRPFEGDPRCHPAYPHVVEVAAGVRPRATASAEAVEVGEVAAQRDPLEGVKCVTYLLALSSLCREAARDPRLLPEFAAIVQMVPGTLVQLQRAARRIAA